MINQTSTIGSTPATRPARPTYEDVVNAAAASASPDDAQFVKKITAPGQPQHVNFVVITPGAAGLILRDHNGSNRSFKMHVALGYSVIVKRGDWQCDKDTLAFDTTGKLRDGQHRLFAIAECGVATKIGITLGEPVTAARYYDGGKARGADAILEMNGISYPRIRPAVMKNAVAYQQRFETGKTTPMDREEIVRLSELHGSTLVPAIGLAENSMQVPESFPASFEPCLSLQEAATVAYLMLAGGWSTSIIGSFLNELQQGIGKGENSPIERGAGILLQDRRSKSKGGLRVTQKTSLALTVARLWATNKRQSLRAPKPKDLAPYQRPDDLPPDPIGDGITVTDTSTRSN